MLLRKSVFLLGIISLQFVAICCGAKSSSACPKRTETDARCRRGCRTDADCKTKRRNKKCICDGPCGLSCVRINQKCYEDRFLVTRLRKGKVNLNGERYTKKTFKVGDVIKYSCKNGFKLSGPSIVTCSGIGKWKPWDKGTPTCSKRCADPGNPVHGRRVKGLSFDVGETVRFICLPGYSLQGSGRAKCQKNLQWSSPPPKCKVTECPKPVLPENSSIERGKRDSYPYGSRIYLTCHSGFFRMGSSLMYCGFGGWQSPTRRLLRCMPKSCGTPGSIDNGYIQGSQYTVGKSVTYKCNLGYKLRGYRQRRCLAIERWSGKAPICDRVECGDIDDISNGKIKQFGTTYLDKAILTCDPGYLFTGSSEITCMANGEWSEKPRCLGVSCDKNYTSFENGVVVGKLVDSACVNSYNCKLTFSCNSGYKFDSGRTNEIAFCQGNGKWSILKPECQRISCVVPYRPRHGKVAKTSNDYLYESVLEYKCNSGYDMIGVATRECLADGKWSGDVPHCQAYCDYPGDLLNGNVHGLSYKSGDTISYSCKSGYQLSGSKTRTCDQNTARWTGWKPECRRISCVVPYPPRHGKVAKTSNDYLYESVLEYKCNSGYDMIGVATRECLADGKWSGDVPHCQANCSDPGTPGNGYKEGSEFTGGKTVTFKCYKGYGIVGVKEITCNQETAKWSRETPKCEKKCDAPLGMEEGMPRLGSNDNWCGKYVNGETALKIRFKSVVKITDVYFRRADEKKANEGWFHYFDATRRSFFFRKVDYDMKEYNNFKLPQPIQTSFLEIVFKGKSGDEVCEQLEIYGCNASSTCPIPQAPRNGESLGLLYKEGQTAVYSCSHGYKLSDDRKQTCQADGTWTGDIPECIEDDIQDKCYKDFPSRRLRYFNANYSPRDCLQVCKRFKYKYAGLQYAHQCFCGNEISSDIVAPVEDCYVPCDHDPSRKCGGPWRNSIYKTGIK